MSPTPVISENRRRHRWKISSPDSFCDDAISDTVEGEEEVLGRGGVVGIVDIVKNGRERVLPMTL